MDVFYAYTYSTTGWLSLQALPLLLSPGLIVTLLSTEARNATGEALVLRHIAVLIAQVLEIYFSRSLAISLLAVALLTGLLTGSIPLTSSAAESSIPTSFLRLD